MKKSLLKIEKLVVEVGGKRVLKGVNFEIGKGEIKVVMGPNGSGKSSLAMALMGSSEYRVVKSEGTRVELAGKKLLEMEIDERARAGMFLAWQNPVAIPGVSVFNLGKTAYQTLRAARGEEGEQKSLRELKQEMIAIMKRVGLSEKQLEKGINEGFSGGEKKRLELAQLILLKPKLAILDEIDSGLDADGLRVVTKIVSEMARKGTSFIVITHYSKLLDYLKPDEVLMMKDGKIRLKGGMEVAKSIEKNGYHEQIK